MKLQFIIRAYTPTDNQFVISSIKNTFRNIKPTYDFPSGDNSILIACDVEDPSVIFGFIIVNQANELVFAYTKAIFRLFGIFKALLGYFPIKPSHYITQPSYQAHKALKASKLTYLIRIPL